MGTRSKLRRRLILPVYNDINANATSTSPLSFDGWNRNRKLEHYHLCRIQRDHRTPTLNDSTSGAKVNLRGCHVSMMTRRGGGRPYRYITHRRFSDYPPPYMCIHILSSQLQLHRSCVEVHQDCALANVGVGNQMTFLETFRFPASTLCKESPYFSKTR